MVVQKIKPVDAYLGGVFEQHRAALMASVHASLDAAREQVGRSFRIVAQSQELIGRTRQSLARSNQIRRGISSPAHNPVIVIPETD
jgi:hypothetical protein